MGNEMSTAHENSTRVVNGGRGSKKKIRASGQRKKKIQLPAHTRTYTQAIEDSFFFFFFGHLLLPH